jgi:hypothetical protein
MTSSFDDQRLGDKINGIFLGQAYAKVIILAGRKMLIEFSYMVENISSEKSRRKAYKTKG